MKHYIIKLICISILSFFSCNTKKEVDETEIFKKRAHKFLQKSAIDITNKKKIIVWTNSSCQGCRASTVNTLMNNEILEDIEVIIPQGLAHGEATYLSEKFKFIDKDNIFGNTYFGISNVGIIYLENDSIVAIKDYNTDEMEAFERDILN